MQTNFEDKDIKAIASAVMEMLKPMLSGNGKQADIDRKIDIDFGRLLD